MGSCETVSKQILTLILFVVLSNNIYSQKCENKKDPFTNEQIVSFDFRQKTIYFELKKEKILLDIVFNYWGERNYEFDEGTELLIKLENGIKIELKTIRKAIPKIEKITSSNSFASGNGFSSRFGGGMIASSSENFTAYSFTFLLTKNELNKLAESRIDVIRIPDTDEGKYIDLKAKGRTKKKIKVIKKGAICISENINI